MRAAPSDENPFTSFYFSCFYLGVFISHATILCTSRSAKRRENPSNAVNFPLPARSYLIVYLFINYGRSYLKIPFENSRVTMRFDSKLWNVG